MLADDGLRQVKCLRVPFNRSWCVISAAGHYRLPPQLMMTSTQAAEHGAVRHLANVVSGAGGGGGGGGAEKK